jgi:hypothetical protein
MRGLVVIGSELINNQVKTVGLFDNKPFDMTWDPVMFTSEIEGDLNEAEKAQLLIVFETQQLL